MEVSKGSGGLRERTRRAVRDHIAELAFTLYVDHGFEETTIDEIVRAAGLSRRSFFRYFHSKEDPVLGVLAHAGGVLANTLRKRPPEESIWEALRMAFREPVNHELSQEQLLGRVRLIMQTPALQARHFEHQEQWRMLISEALLERAVSRLDRYTASVVTMAALGAFNAASREWVMSNGARTLAELIDHAFAIMAPAGL